MADPEISCFRCGTCCVAPDISTLDKPVDVPCAHLQPDHLCGIYADRPAVCRDYRPDDICVALQQIPPEQRVAYYLNIFGLTETASMPGLTSSHKNSTLCGFPRRC